MAGLLVRPDRGDLSVACSLNSFITDWEAARSAFIGCIKDGFRNLTNPRP